jgi:hypothetical protein
MRVCTRSTARHHDGQSPVPDATAVGAGMAFSPGHESQWREATYAIFKLA